MCIFMCTFRVVPRMYIYIYILGLYTMCIFVLKVTYACCANLAGLFPLLVFAAGLNKVLEYKLKERRGKDECQDGTCGFRCCVRISL